jgi:acyl-CoA dehydrogenase
MIPTVPELSADIRELKERVGAFLEREVYPLEKRVAEAGRIDPEWTSELRRKSWDEGFGMLNMPEEAGGRGLPMLGQVALEEESGKATNGLGFAVVDRGPAELWDIATPEQRERFVTPVLRGEYREAWAVTEPGAGSDVSGIVATAERDGDEWILNGEKWFVTSAG